MEGHRDFLKKLTLADVLNTTSKKQLVTLPISATVQEALDVLRDNNILSVPLVDTKDEIKGVLNISDICTAVAFQKAFEGVDMPLKESEITALLQSKVFEARADSLLGISAESKTGPWEYDSTTPLDTVLDVMAKGVHRVIVNSVAKDGKTKERQLLSQADVIRFLKPQLHTGKLGEMPNGQLKDIGLYKADAKKEIKTLSMYHSALAGFKTMYNNGWEISAVPVVDFYGDIVTTLSQSDLRGINKESFGRLTLPVLDFLRSVSGYSRPAISCRSTSTLAEVMTKITWANVHRVWIVDNNKIVGVVSLTDIICKFSPYDFKKPVEKEAAAQSE